MTLTVKKICSVFFWVCIVLILANVLIFFALFHKDAVKDKKAVQSAGRDLVQEQLTKLRADLDRQLLELEKLKAESKELVRKVVDFKVSKNASLKENFVQLRDTGFIGLPVVIPVLVIACNRPANIKRTLDAIFKHKPADNPNLQFSVIVSQDCAHAATATVIGSYGARVTHLKQPDQSQIATPPKEKNLQGYFRIARHFKWALDQVFVARDFQAVIVVEDDLDIAPDFFDYFSHLSRAMAQDPSIWCISAWNDNGIPSLIDEKRPELFHRTDFFPGLGWMIFRRVWMELRENWPAAYWDDHLRKAHIRKGRSCIRPEISRSFTFGKVGVSHGLFYDKFLKFIKLNDKQVDFASLNFTSLVKGPYEAAFNKSIANAKLVSIEDVLKTPGSLPETVKVEYKDKKDFQRITKLLGAMSDFKDGVPRTGYLGVVSVYKNNRRVFIVPPPSWTGYVQSWK